MSGGTFNVSRSLWDDPAFKNEPFSEREAWLWMLSEASWKPRQKRVASIVVSLDRGQFACSLRFMADAFMWHKNKADRFLKRLQNLYLVSVESGTGVNIVTICNYEKYQGQRDSSGTRSGQQRDSSGTNDKKGERKKESIYGDFDAFWQACPRKIGKDAARRAYSKAVKSVDPEKIKSAMVDFAKSQADTDKQFIPHPATWLNAGRWDDEPEQKSAGPRIGEIRKTSQGWKEYVDGLGWCKLHPGQVADMGLE